MFYLASSTATCTIHVIPVSVQTIRAPFLRTGSAHDSLLLMRSRVILLFLAQVTEADGDYIRALNPESPFLWCMCMCLVCVRRAKMR